MRAIFLISTLSLVLGGTAYAADLGQYRPGNPYQSVIAPGADVCESHCAGDAQCRSWNYVKASPQASGVCEFNANDVSPVASAISISGSNTAIAYRPGVVPGGTNTIRVGTAPIAQNQSKSQTQTTPTRRIVREPVPQQNQVQTASTGSLTAQQNQYRQGTALREQRQMPQSLGDQNQGPQNGQPMMPQGFTYDLGGLPSQPQLGQPQLGRQNQGQASLPQNSRPQPYPPQMMDSATYARPPQPRPPQQRQPQQNYAPQYQPAQPAPQQGQVTRTDRRRHQGPTMPTSPMQQDVASLTQPHQGRGPQTPSYQTPSYQGAAYQAPVYQGQTYQGPVHQGQRPAEQSQGQAFPPQGNYAPQSAPQYAPQVAAQNAPIPRRSATDPLTYGEAASAQMSRQAPYPTSNSARSQMAAQGLSAEQAHQSLFGKLNDNVQVPNSAEDVPSDPNAPIPTMTSRASGRVEQSTLAGGPY